ncbi:MAG: hypothetical protein NTW90_04180 [Nitrosospira sp.]|nr:hypothetical protein [Nitrosospira sp.]
MNTGIKAALFPLVLFTTILLLSSGQSGANQTAPFNYAQCIKAAANTAASEAARTCLEKFPGEVPEDENLTAEALGKLDAAGGSGYGVFSGSIYNGNGDYTVTQVTILLTPIPAGSPLITSEYNIDVTVQPLTKSALSVALISDVTREFSWSLTKARGYKAR